MMGGISQIRCCSLDIEYSNLFEKYYGSIWAEQQDKIEQVSFVSELFPQF